MKKILYVGENWLGSTSLLRLNALKRLGHRVDNIDFSHTFQRNSFKDIYFRLLNKLDIYIFEQVILSANCCTQV